MFNGTPEVTLIAHVGSITVDGPYAASGPGTTPSRARIFTCVPRQASEEAACAREILSTIAYRAYRQPPSTEHLSVLMDFYAQGYEKGGFDKGIETGLQRILSSPQFVFRFERDPADAAEGAYAISDSELASRLAFFLWSSIPDDELLELASRNRLSRPAVLEQQVRRMLADPKATALTQEFRGTVALSAQSRDQGRVDARVPGLRRQPAQFLPPRDGAVVRARRCATTRACSSC